jgi:hypothetical protein
MVSHGCFQFPNSVSSAILESVSRLLRLVITKHNHNHRSRHLTVAEPQDSLKAAETPAFQIVDKSKETYFVLPDVLYPTNMHPVFFNENSRMSLDDLQCHNCYREFETTLCSVLQFMP